MFCLRVAREATRRGEVTAAVAFLSTELPIPALVLASRCGKTLWILDSADQAGQRFLTFQGDVPVGSSRTGCAAVSLGRRAVAGLFASGLQVVPPELAGRQRPFGPPGTAFLQCHRTALRYITIPGTAGVWADRPEQRSLERY